MFQLFLVASASAAAAIFFAVTRLTVFFSTNCADAFRMPTPNSEIAIANVRSIFLFGLIILGLVIFSLL